MRPWADTFIRAQKIDPDFSLKAVALTHGNCYTTLWDWYSAGTTLIQLCGGGK